MLLQGQRSAAVLLRLVQGSAGASSSPDRGSLGVWRSAVGLFCYCPGSGFAGGTAGRPAPAAAASGASGLGAAPRAPAIYTPECRKGQVEPKTVVSTQPLLSVLQQPV